MGGTPSLDVGVGRLAGCDAGGGAARRNLVLGTVASVATSGHGLS